MNNRLLFYTRLFLLIFGSYPCYWTVFSWKTKKYEHVYSVGTYSLKLCSALGQLRAVGEQKPGVGDVLSAGCSAGSHGPLTNVAPKWRTVIISFEYHGRKYHLFAAFRILQIPFYGNILILGLFNSTR